MRPLRRGTLWAHKIFEWNRTCAACEPLVGRHILAFAAINKGVLGKWFISSIVSSLGSLIGRDQHISLVG